MNDFFYTFDHIHMHMYTNSTAGSSLIAGETILVVVKAQKIPHTNNIDHILL